LTFNRNQSDKKWILRHNPSTRHEMKAQAVNNLPITPFRLISSNGPQIKDLTPGFSGILDRATQADGLNPTAAASPAPASPAPASPARSRPDQGRSLVATLALTPGPVALDAPITPGGMANGTTASLLARGFVKFLAAPGLNRADLPSAGAAALQPVNRIHPVAMELGDTGNAPTPDLGRPGPRPGNGFAVKVD
jgi:hypothetical protein